jgi:hypothetical protein
MTSGRLIQRIRAWARSRTRRSVPKVLAIVLPSCLILAGLGAAVSGARIDLSDGAAWLPSSIGQVALLSGASARPIATVAVAAGGHDLSVAQSGSDGYVIDHTAGTVSRVEGATFAASAPVPFARGASSGLQVLIGGGNVYVLDSDSGLLAARFGFRRRSVPRSPHSNTSASRRTEICC